MTPQITRARVVVPEGAPRTVWMMERGEGVTASEAWEIARGVLKTWRRVLESKLNGSRFHGNKATSAGHAREAALLDEAAERMATLTPNGALWAAVENDLHRATPDAIAIDPDGALVVVEVKSHDHKWDSDGIPVEHMAQMQWQIHVLGADYALYGFEVRDEDDMPPVDGATWIPVPRDDEMIEFLIWRADRFIAWRDAGCPETDELPDEVRAALDEWAPLKKSLDDAAAKEKKAAAALKKAIATLPYAERFGAVGMGELGGFQSVVSEKVSIDEADWAADAPDVHAAVVKLRADLVILEAAAKKTYPKLSRSSSLRFQEIEVQDV